MTSHRIRPVSGWALAAVLVAGVAVSGCRSDAADTTDASGPGLGSPALLAASCSGCHGTDGAAIPVLDDLTADMIAASLKTYRDDAAGSTVMHRLTRGYSDAEIDAIAAYLAAEGGG